MQYYTEQLDNKQIVMNNMHKWELRNKQKHHDAIIQNARPSVTKVCSQSKSIKSSSHHRTTKLTPPNPRKLNLKNQMPINKILKLFQLQKYTDLITDKKLQKLIESEDSILDIQNLIEQADVEDKQKLTSLVHTLIVMSKDIKKNPIKVIRLKQSDHTLPSLNKNKKQSNQKTVQKFRVRAALHHRTPEKPPIHVHYEVHKKNETIAKSQSKDDSHYVHEFDLKGQNADHTCDGYITQMKNKNHVLRRLFERLQSQRYAQYQFDKQININAVQNMYQSFESGRLNSNISDLDFQGMLYCLALQTKGLCDKGQLTRVLKEKQEIIEDLLRQSILMHYHEDQREEAANVGQMKKNIKTHSNEVIFNPEDPPIEEHIEIEDIKNFIENIILQYQISKDNLIKAYILLQNCISEELIDIYHTNWKYMIIAILFCLNFESMMKGKSEIHLVWDKIKEEPYIDALMDKKIKITKKEYVNAYFAMRASFRSELDHRKFGNSKNQRIKVCDILRMQNHGQELLTKGQFLNKRRNKSF